jgi:hypothetical protein
VAGDRALLALLAVLPFVFIAAASQVRPLLNQRGLLFAAPYLLLALAMGWTALRKPWRMAALPLLALVCAASLASYRTMTVDPTDYHRFASAITREIRAGDLVFVRKIWSETPILYYLPPGRYRLVGREFEAACAGDPGARVWVVLINGLEPTPEMRQALAGYQAVRDVPGDRARATLYQRSGAPLLSQAFEN